MLGITQDQCPSARLTGPRRTELMWLNFGILIGKESHFPVWFLRKKDACPGADGPLSHWEKSCLGMQLTRKKTAERWEGENPQAPETRFKTSLRSALPRPLTTEACWRGSSRGRERAARWEAPHPPRSCSTRSVRSSQRGGGFKAVLRRQGVETTRAVNVTQPH